LTNRRGLDFAVGQIVEYFVERFFFGFHILNSHNRIQYNNEGFSRKPNARNRCCVQWLFKYVCARLCVLLFVVIRCRVDPPNGRLPPLTSEAQKIFAADRAFRLALLQSTETCKNKEPACNGGTYDAARSPRFAEQPLRYNATRMNRNDGPEDSSLAERCLTGGIPEFGGPTGSFRRIVQTPGGISIFYDVGQGQGWQRNIVMNGSPHLPASVRQWYGDSRGRWEGDTLVIDVTNFSPKADFQGSRENLHVVERFTRTGPSTLLYEATIEDPTVWTRLWSVKEDFTQQSDRDNRLYTEPRCVEGNYGLPGIINGRRNQDRAFAEGRGSDPATRDAMKDGFIFDDEPLR
jgi:hypothetical protein